MQGWDGKNLRKYGPQSTTVRKLRRHFAGVKLGGNLPYRAGAVFGGMYGIYLADLTDLRERATTQH